MKSSTVLIPYCISANNPLRHRLYCTNVFEPIEKPLATCSINKRKLYFPIELSVPKSENLKTWFMSVVIYPRYYMHARGLFDQHSSQIVLKRMQICCYDISNYCTITHPLFIRYLSHKLYMLLYAININNISTPCI